MPKILIIEDEENTVEFLTIRLSREGFTVLSANDSYKGIALAHKEMPDLIILDLMLPAGGGLTVLKRIKAVKETSGIPVLVLTANKSPGYRQKVMAEGVEAYVEKPYDSQELVVTIKKLLDSHRANP